MWIAEDYKSVFQDSFIEKHKETLTVNETDPQAQVKKADFKKAGGSLLYIKKDFLEATQKLFVKNDICTMIEMDHCCDGIIVTEREGEFFVFFVELKSKYSKHNVERAFNQLRASIIKLIGSLYPLKSFNSENIYFGGILVSLPISSEDLVKYQNFKKIGKNYFDFCLKLHFDKYLNMDCDEMKCSILPLKQEFIPNNFSLFHIESGEEQEIDLLKLESILLEHNLS